MFTAGIRLGCQSVNIRAAPTWCNLIPTRGYGGQPSVGKFGAVIAPMKRIIASSVVGSKTEKKLWLVIL